MEQKKPRKKRILSRSKFSQNVLNKEKRKAAAAERKKASKEKARETAAQRAVDAKLKKRPFQYEDEEMFPEIRATHQSEFFHAEPVNEIHRLIKLTPYAEEYGYKMFGDGSFTFANRVVRPENMTAEQVIQLSGFLGVNPIWMFMQIMAEYNEILAQKTGNLSLSATRFRKAYWLRSEAKRVKESHGLATDVLETFSLVSEQGKYTRDAQDQDSQDDQ